MIERVRILWRRAHPFGVMVAASVPEGAPTEADIGRLHPQEQAALLHRKGFSAATWVAGRIALAEALADVGAPRKAVLTDDRGAPAAPTGYVVSLSHKTTIAVALAAVDDGARLGVDVENAEPDRARIARKVLTPAEMAIVEGLEGEARWLEVLGRFSIKECVYKAIDPFVRRYVSFMEAEIPELIERPRVQLSLTAGEGPFEVEATWAPGEPSYAAVRIRETSKP